MTGETRNNTPLPFDLCVCLCLCAPVCVCDSFWIKDSPCHAELRGAGIFHISLWKTPQISHKKPLTLIVLSSWLRSWASLDFLPTVFSSHFQSITQIPPLNAAGGHGWATFEALPTEWNCEGKVHVRVPGGGSRHVNVGRMGCGSWVTAGMSAGLRSSHYGW